MFQELFPESKRYKDQMASIGKHRMIALFLTATFVLSNVGLPIILSSCPMIGKMTQHCPMCTDHAKAPARQLTSTGRNTCCRTVIAAERNKTEFIGTQDARSQLTALTCILPILHPIELSETRDQFFERDLFRFHLSRDIPTLTSSFLI
jgi:hypothetical protein